MSVRDGGWLGKHEVSISCKHPVSSAPSALVEPACSQLKETRSEEASRALSAGNNPINTLPSISGLVC